ncbi:unnamed protein product [Rhodiola kirilowii]
MERSEAHKRDASFRSKQPSSIETTTPRLQPDQRRQPSFSSPAYSPAVSPSLSDHTSRGFYSPRGGEEDEDDDAEYEEEELHEDDDRGVLYRPRSPPVLESPVTTTVSRSVRVEPEVVTRVDNGPKEREFIERRVVEDGDMDFGAGRALARRKWEGKNTIVFDSGLKHKEVVPERRIGEEASVELRDRRGMHMVGQKRMEFDSGPKENDIVPERRIAEEDSVEVRDGRAHNLVGRNAIVFDSGPKEKGVVTRQGVVEEGSVEFRDGRGLNLQGRNTIVLNSVPSVVYDSRPKEEVVRTRTVVYESGSSEEAARVVEEGGTEGAERGEGMYPSLRQRQEGKRSQVLAMRKTALCLRVLAFILCLISFSVMAANKNKGWALDSFDRYMEFRYCMAVSIIGFVYSAAQACNVAYHLGTDKHSNQHSQFRYYLDFFMDQVLSYLLISASSSAATRVEDWVSNWGIDKFPQMASVSFIFSFLAFGAFAFSSLVSGYALCSAANVS